MANHWWRILRVEYSSQRQDPRDVVKRPTVPALVFLAQQADNNSDHGIANSHDDLATSHAPRGAGHANVAFKIGKDEIRLHVAPPRD
jgi:hypothetical protein